MAEMDSILEIIKTAARGFKNPDGSMEFLTGEDLIKLAIFKAARHERDIILQRGIKGLCLGCAKDLNRTQNKYTPLCHTCEMTQIKITALDDIIDFGKDNW